MFSDRLPKYEKKSTPRPQWRTWPKMSHRLVAQGATAYVQPWNSTKPPAPRDSQSQTEVLYNAECPVCNFEISHYADHARDKGLAIRDDLNRRSATGLMRTPPRAALCAAGDRLVSGIDGFLLLWAEMPKYRWLGRIVAVPGILHLARFGYDYVLAPSIYRWHRWRTR